MSKSGSRPSPASRPIKRFTPPSPAPKPPSTAPKMPGSKVMKPNPKQQVY
jgi:hypothetical protein